GATLEADLRVVLHLKLVLFGTLPLREGRVMLHLKFFFIVACPLRQRRVVLHLKLFFFGLPLGERRVVLHLKLFFVTLPLGKRRVVLHLKFFFFGFAHDRATGEHARHLRVANLALQAEDGMKGRRRLVRGRRGGRMFAC